MLLISIFLSVSNLYMHYFISELDFLENKIFHLQMYEFKIWKSNDCYIDGYV
jgi:hypothetical protein